MTPGNSLGIYPLKMAFLGVGIFLGFSTSLRKVSLAYEWLKNFTYCGRMLMGLSCCAMLKSQMTLKSIKSEKLWRRIKS